MVILLLEKQRPPALVSHMCATCSILPPWSSEQGKGFSRLLLPQLCSLQPVQGWLRHLSLRTPNL